MQISIRKNFIKFVNDVEFEKQSKMLRMLKKSYGQNGGWEDYRRNTGSWHRLLSESRPGNGGPGPGKPLPFHGPQGDPLPPRPMDPRSLHRRLCLFDADKTYVAGACRQEGQFDFHPIVLSGQTIGWLGLENSDEMRNPLELVFLKKQVRSFYAIGFGILFLALVISYISARHILSPIQALARGTRAMGKFDFDTRICVNSADELGELARDFNLMAQTLKQYETMRKNWISDISHELRTPVAVILSKIEALQDGIRELTPELLNSLHRDILGLGKLIDDLHRISLMESKNLPKNLKPVSLLSLFNRFELKQIDIRKEESP